MTLADRAAAYAVAFPDQPASHLRLVREQGRDVLYGRWVLGQDYRNKTSYYGAYPPGYLARVMALFPDALGSETMHVFSGSLPEGNYIRCDVQRPAELRCDILDVPAHVGADRFRLLLADPPYTSADSKKYGTPPLNKRGALSALAAIAHSGAHLCWLDTIWPMHSKREWLTVGRIAITRSTNHRLRDLSIFERTGAA